MYSIAADIALKQKMMKLRKVALKIVTRNLSGVMGVGREGYGSFTGPCSFLPLDFYMWCRESLEQALVFGTISIITDRLSFFLWWAGLRLEKGYSVTHKTFNFANSLNFCFAKK